MRRYSLIVLFMATLMAEAQAAGRPIQFDRSFEAGSLGRIETLGDAEFRLWIEGQQDERGRNHQATWFFARMDGVAGRELTLRIAGFPGEYNGRPDARVKHHYRPVYSEDGTTWNHFDHGTWETATIELTVKIRPQADSLWIAYLHPYPLSRLHDLVREIGRSPHARVETIGTSVQERPLHLVTVTNRDRPDDAKRRVWLIARQHAWETGTSFVMEGALRFIVSEDPAARRLRDDTIFRFVPTMDPDGCANGAVRFNANGYDLNRHWLTVDLQDEQWRRKMPEIWHVKQALRNDHARAPVDLVVNLHNNDMNEYMATMVDDGPPQETMHRLFAQLQAVTTFDPSRPGVTILPAGGDQPLTTNALWTEFGLPVVLLEHRIGPGRKLGRRPTIEDRLQFGRQLPGVMAEVVR